MPEIDLDAMQIMALQRVLRDNDIEIPDERLDSSEWVEQQLEERDDTDRGLLAEHAPHETAENRVLYDIGNACPICGDSECDENVNYIGSTPIHASQHPENQPRSPR